MRSVVHRADSRGHLFNNWLDTHPTFSFESYQNKERSNFGALTVLNDESVKAGMGNIFRPHKNMEIISIPLSGQVKYQDNLGNDSVLHHNEIQVITAGTGILHSKQNMLSNKEAQLLQLWIYPKKMDQKPALKRMAFDPLHRKNDWQIIVSPIEDLGICINQDAYISICELDKGIELDYCLKKCDNGVYFFLLNGQIDLEGFKMNPRDGIGIWDTKEAMIRSLENQSKILAIEVPVTKKKKEAKSASSSEQ